jgi:hypothetical protein
LIHNSDITAVSHGYGLGKSSHYWVVGARTTWPGAVVPEAFPVTFVVAAFARHQWLQTRIPKLDM